MSRSFRRFEILLPLRFNDGRTVPDELVGQTLEEIQDKFGAVSCESQTVRGVWRQEGQTYRDESVRVFVDVPDTQESSAFFHEFKDRLKSRFAQIDIWITTYPIDVF